jgi:hypothetical protein
MFLAVALALVTAVASAAVGQPKPLQTGSFLTIGGTKTTQTCQATRRHQSVRRGKFIPIACEQPPGLNFSSTSLAKVAAIDSLG